MPAATPAPLHSRANTFLLGVAILKVAVHVACLPAYGWFRDELYYVACARHLAWGYVDQPPLSLALLAVLRAGAGDSLVAIRLAAVLAGAAAVFLTGLLARRLGGSVGAQVLAALAALAAPIWLGMQRTFSMNAFDILLWTVAAHLLTSILPSEPSPRATRLWLAFGLVLGLGLLNKLSILWLAAGIGTALVASARRWLRTPGPYLAAGLAGLLFLPHVLWQVAHGWPTLEFMRNASAGKYRVLSPLAFLSGAALQIQPLAVPLAVAGLVWLLAARKARPFRPLGVVLAVVLAILLANRTSKPEYLSVAYAPLLAAGSVALADFLGSRRVALGAYGVLLALGGAVLAPFALPILPVETYIRYAKTLGVAPGTPERKEVGPLPQHFADMFGWPEMVETIASVRASLSEEERAHCSIFVQNYGEAGAVDLFGRRKGLPPALSGHNNYFLWGLRGVPGDVVLVYGGRREDHERVFARVEAAAVFRHPLVMPYENGRTVFVCREPKVPLESVWPRVKNYS